jgi:hypothetical protein
MSARGAKGKSPVAQDHLGGRGGRRDDGSDRPDQEEGKEEESQVQSRGREEMWTYTYSCFSNVSHEPSFETTSKEVKWRKLAGVPATNPWFQSF